MMLGCVIVYQYAKQSAVVEVQQFAANSLRQITNDISQIVELCCNIVINVGNDKNLYQILLDEQISDLDKVDAILFSLAPRMEAVKGQNTFIQSLRVFHYNKKLPAVYDYLYYESMLKTSSWMLIPAMKSALPIKGKSVHFIGMHDDILPFSTESEPALHVVSFAYPIIAPYGQKCGVAVLDISDETLLQSLRAMNLDHGQLIMLYNEKGTLVHTNNLDLASRIPGKFTSGTEVEINGLNYLVLKEGIKSIGYNVAYFIPESIWKDKYLIPGIFLILFAGLATMIILAFFLSKLVVGKLEKLTATIHAVRNGNWDTKVNIKSQDEIGALASDFNDMTETIHQLISDNQKLNEAEKISIYSSLEEQIKPHFLCNALDMIRMTAEVENRPLIARAAGLIANYFNYNMAQKLRYVTLAVELKNASDYLDIYNLIYNNRIQYHINIDSSVSGRLEKYQVLKYILQPIVENCVKHGFGEKQAFCAIVINVTIKSGLLCIYIEDNGKGMTEAEIQSLEAYTYESSASEFNKGIGLHNIIDRLKIIYGLDFHISIESLLSVGTMVTLKFPASMVVDTADISMEGQRCQG